MILLLPCFSAGGAEGVGLEDLAALLDDVEVVCVEVFEGVHLAGWPADLDQVDFFRLVEAEMDAQVVLRVVAASAADFVDLDNGVPAWPRSGLCDDLDPRADAGAVGFCADGTDLDPVALER